MCKLEFFRTALIVICHILVLSTIVLHRIDSLDYYFSLTYVKDMNTHINNIGNLSFLARVFSP